MARATPQQRARIPRIGEQPQRSASSGPAARPREQARPSAPSGASRPLPPRKPASEAGTLHTFQSRMPLEEYTPPPMESFNWIRLLLIALLCVTLLTGAAYFYLRATDEGQYLLASWGMEASGDAYATLGRQKILEGAIVQAVHALEIAQSKDPNNLEILMDLGAAYEANNRLDRAELAYRRAIQYKSIYPEPYRRLIALFMETNREYEALQCMALAFERTEDESFETMLANARPPYPRVDIQGGNFAEPFDLTLTAPMEGAEIRYTLDGTDPFLGQVYTAPIYMDEGGWTLRSVCVVGNLVSQEQNQVYTVRYPAPDMPKPTLAVKTYSSVQTVGLRAGKDVIAIYYTTDGSEPTLESKVYTSPIQLRVGKTRIRAIAVNSAGKISNEMDLTYECEGKVKASMAEKDVFTDLKLFSTTREAFEKKYGAPQSEEDYGADSLGTYTRCLYPFGYAVFLNRGEDKKPVLAELSTTSGSMVGPRGAKVGMSLSDALALFRDGGGEDDGKGNRILYNIDSGVSAGNLGLLHYMGDDKHEIHYYCKVEKDYIELALYAEQETIVRIEWLRYRVE